jgi:hypothetical protein
LNSSFVSIKTAYRKYRRCVSQRKSDSAKPPHYRGANPEAPQLPFPAPATLVFRERRRVPPPAS